MTDRLPPAPWTSRTDLARLITALGPGNTRYVGGAVRDTLLGIEVKDIDLAMELGEELGVPMWVCQAARLVFKHAVFEGMADQDMTNIVRVVERGAGFEIPKTR